MATVRIKVELWEGDILLRYDWVSSYLENRVTFPIPIKISDSEETFLTHYDLNPGVVSAEG